MIEAQKVSKMYSRGVYAVRELSLRIDKIDHDTVDVLRRHLRAAEATASTGSVEASSLVFPGDAGGPLSSQWVSNEGTHVAGTGLV